MIPYEEFKFDGRSVTLKWIEANVAPSDTKVSQVSGFCFDSDGNILIIKNERGWNFPGGHPESNETVLQTLERELLEEAAVTILAPKLFGYTEVDDPDNESVEGKHYVQLRFIARIDELKPFDGRYETDERKLVGVDELAEYIPWIGSVTASAQTKTMKNVLKELES